MLDSLVDPTGSVVAGRVRKSRTGRIRAMVLIGIHVAVFAHIVHWKLAGKTLAPMEPSEAMYTVADGFVNAGVVVLLLSILSTMILGRWFCGWACHVVALQDFCGWLMKRVGIRPRPLKSRALMWVPLGAGLYMFGMPLFVRMWRDLGLPDFVPEFTKVDFWETFPGPWVAGITFLVCGFVMVYVLGAKGFCTYACPYGGLFGVADKIAPGRIRVTDACRGCGHCTVACTSNVVVHEEVATYGMVVDPGCMKCKDCISVCPENALYFGFGKPALLARAKSAPAAAIAKKARRKRFDFHLGEEIVMVLAFALTLFVFQGLPRAFAPWAETLYGQTPLLLSLGLAALTAFLVVMTWRLLRRPEGIRFLGEPLRENGALNGRGRWFVIATVLWFAFIGWHGLVQAFMFQGEREYIALQDDNLLSWGIGTPKPTGERKQRLERTRVWFERADTFGLFPDPRVPSRLGVVLAAEGEIRRSITEFKRAVEIDADATGSHLDLARLYIARDELDGAERSLLTALEVLPHNPKFRPSLLHAAMVEFEQVMQKRFVGGNPRKAENLVNRGLELAPDAIVLRRMRARLLIGTERIEDGIVVLRDVIEHMPNDVGSRYELGSILVMTGRSLDEAKEQFDTLVELHDFAPAHVFLAEIHRRKGELKEAEAAIEKAVASDPNAPMTVAVGLASAGQQDQAKALLEIINKVVPGFEMPPVFQSPANQ